MTQQRQLPRLVWSLRTFLFAVVAFGAVGFIVWGFIQGRRGAAIEAQREQPVKPPQRVSVQNGESVITLNSDAQQRTGIEIATLHKAPHHEQLRGYGTVLDLQQLVDLNNSYVSATAQLQTAQAKLAASQPAFERAQTLYKNGQTISAAQLQTAEATYRIDQAARSTAESQLRTLSATAQQSWGPVLGQAIVSGSTMITRLIERRDFLVQITLPPGVFIVDPPQIAFVQRGDRARVQVRFVSPATKTDPKIQGLSFFYSAPAQSGILPGLNVLALLPSSTKVQAVLVPESALVWWQGKAWVYVRTGPENFTRREITTDQQAPQGGYIVQALPDEVAIVVQGAQSLLSEEFRAQVRVGQD